MSWFDLQINGYGGVDFNQEDLNGEDLNRACCMLKEHGLRGILATIISDSIEEMANRIKRIVRLREEDEFVREMIWGIHVEGPFLNPQDGFRGAHPAAAICLADVSVAARLLEAGDGIVRLLTLAPEQDLDANVCRNLVGQGVVVSAGHTNASLDELKQSIDAGLSMFTHLGNGCPMLLPRHDNIVQRALSLRKDLDLCFIADGIHIPFLALRNYLSLIEEKDKIIVTTDAISAAGLGPGKYRVGQWEVAVGPDMAARSPDGTHLVGSAVPMSKLLDNLRTHLQLSEPEIARIADGNARRALRLTGPLK